MEACEPKRNVPGGAPKVWLLPQIHNATQNYCAPGNAMGVPPKEESFI